MLSKTDLAQVEVDQIRPITKLLHTLKVIEKAIKAKAEELGNGYFKQAVIKLGLNKTIPHKIS
jgi:hypothetical protein